MRSIFKNSISIFIIAVILMIIVPLPPFFLDLMFIINIAFAIVILLTTMYVREALEFSVFPSLLLITTLFRLSLNVSSTRLILTNNGHAGAVIATFGSFVLQGNAVVGFIIFLIIVLVQFIVITKGAERVAEVTARFTLDAMPGKQMAIDADLSSGIITEQEAMQRRKGVQRESDFYGAMDGATKFVKGDAIMAIVITFINFVGGVIIGMVQGGDTFAGVLQTYSIATVGDGLVSQIPALLISTATSMIVTRAASESSLNVDLTKQIRSQPVVLIISGVVILFMVFIPGFPLPQVITLSSLLIFLGISLLRARVSAAAETDKDKEEEPVSEEEYFRNIDNIYELIQIDPIAMEVGYSLIPLVDVDGGNFIDRVVMFRRQFAQDMGMVVPSVRLRDNGYLNPNEYVIKVKGEEVAKGEILVEYYLALDPGNLTGEVDGIETIEPAYGIPSKWIKKDKKELAEIYGYTVIDPLSVLITHLSEVVKTHAHELLSRQDLNQLLDKIKKDNKLLVEEVVPGIVSPGNLQKILGNLLKEGIPIKDMETILETISDYGSSVKDTEMLTEYVRQALKRTITRKWSEGGQIRVITLSTDVEKLIINSISKNDKGSYLSIDPELMQKLVTQLIEQINKLKGEINIPIILTSPFVRGYFRKLLDQFYPNSVVLSFNEIDNSVQIQALGNVAI
ncbi:MAG TPA: flagellar biosynthesis protein FlhA [Sedimentibacter sp.]|jgi:flagellar biosynthesis protein FlhA|nr:flagellar biosynthesis protein FlhA [Sedimentibacter sp.]HOG62983.1 flagellar biosynthesis protein FlhA [Sedimentibacter sp.]HPB79457.1 flagellar biosynthesis protein FlhA [Sedimentibacter sp.]HPY55374.1 flagellar biosynthesis protein FlhA [Sedimentibacter sp.]HQC70429.1 flagellar biosynthesis protein FlhA [Sedimentibacter sp.]